MSEVEIAIGIFLFAGGVFLVRLARQTFGNTPEKRIRRAALVRVADLHDGELVKVSGKVRFEQEHLTSPMTETKCAIWDLLLEHRRPHVVGYQVGRTRSALGQVWQDAAAERDAVSFVVEDDSGAVLIEANADSAILLGADVEFRTVGEDRTRVLEILSRKVETRLVEKAEFRYLEWRIEEGAEVAVLGRVAGRADPTQTLRITGTFEEPLYVTDRSELFGRRK